MHFGVQQVFGTQRTTYTCLLFLNKQSTPAFQVEHVAALQAWRYGKQNIRETYQAGTVSDTPWEFVSPQLKTLFKRLRSENSTILEEAAQIFVGVQTSADNVYILHPTSETEISVEFSDADGVAWSLEKAILRSCLHDVPLPSFSVLQPNSYIIFPYHIVGKKACLYTPQDARHATAISRLLEISERS